MDRNYGNRRTEEELEKLKIEESKTLFTLRDQENFNGTQQQLEMMQNFERAYISGAPLISDEEWDLLKHKFNYKESLTSLSPSGREWIKLTAPLPSLDKAGSYEDLSIFLGKFKDGQKFIVENKLDGLTANIRYKLNNEGYYVLECITSRGNGRYGLKLNPYALSGVKINIPERIPAKCVHDLTKDLPAFFELRGEAVIPKNQHTMNKYGENPVWRTIASGIFNRKVPFNLNGVIDYIFDGKESIKTLTNNSTNSYSMEPKFEGRKCVTSDIYENAKLISSLFEEKKGFKPFKRGDILRIYDDSMVGIYHNDGSYEEYYDDGEELDFVIYSAGINEENIDSEALSCIPGIKTISQVKYQDAFKQELNEKEIPVVYRVTDDISYIWEAICDFYGTDLNGKRDFGKPRTRNMYEYACDGVVIKPVDSNSKTQNVDFRNNKNNPNKIICPDYPEDQMAVKLLSEMVKVKIERIETKETSLGNVTCTGILDKEYLTESGAYVSKINLHNTNWLSENSWIKEGNEYWMIMSLDIIPVILNPKEFPVN